MVHRFLSILLLAGLTTPALVTAAEPQRPDIIVLIADDLGRNDPGFMGGREIKTPQLDRLAAAGAKLEAFYVMPVCSPTRAALLTGRHPMRFGMQSGVVRPWAQYGLPLTERTLAQALKEAGYTTAITGKWHLGHFRAEYLPTRRGFDHQYGHYNGAIDYLTHERDGGFDWHRDDKVCRDKGYSTELIADEAVRLIHAQPADRPLFLYVPFNAVHAPHQAPEQYMAGLDHLKGVRRTYAAMLTALDTATGRIAAALEESGRRKNAFIFFSSDNGGPAPGRVTDNGALRAGKGTHYEGGLCVAAFAVYDGHIPAGTTITAPLHVADLFPTCVRLARGSLTGGSSNGTMPLDGKDMFGVLTKGESSSHHALLLNAAPGGGALRAGDWKLIVNAGTARRARRNPERPQAEATGEIELYDLTKDPAEKANVAAAYPDKVRELRALYDTMAKDARPPLGGPAPAGFKAPAVWGEGGGGQ